ncbi:GTP pyrophosphokinase family protein [Clostridium baratii]|uniref:GTP pyrophosphokinase n=1 Tax=Clostridium baratii TaxID=1561 RepID=UPI0006BFE215|nr:GTP pyrophosphokinase family protein [Clostridium baratii]MDU4910611.1 GTP pyrophosphokinase family protein [Clostridium baratii]CUO96325.1 RelA/SpoT domain-containing protein [Clostridium baratii]
MYGEDKCELKAFVENEEFLIWTDLLIKYEFAIEEISTKINILNNEFKLLHDYNPIEHIKTRVKKPKSIIQKLISKGLDPTPENITDNIKDIAGVRIICSFTEDIYLIFNILSNQDDVNVIEVKDYIKNPKENGYRSLHAIVTIPVFLSTGTVNVPVEIQIRTIAMDFWASLEHKIYYKYRNKTLNHISDELKECADIITILDNKMVDIRKEIEKLPEN